MKSFELVLTSRDLTPARLCTITRRDGTVYRIAEAQHAMTVGANTWTPVAGLTIAAVKHTIGGEQPSTAIDLAHADGGTFDTADINNGLFDGAQVDIYVIDRPVRGVLGLLFSGTIQPVVYSIDGSANFDIRGHSAKGDGKFVQTYSAMCRTDLFSVLCGLDEADFDADAEVDTIIDKFNFTVSGLGSSPPADGYFNQGIVVTDGGIAFEIGNWDQSGLQITAYLPCSQAITVGEGLTLLPGCDKRLATCVAKFNNAVNFQGEPHFKGAAISSTSG